MKKPALIAIFWLFCVSALAINKNDAGSDVFEGKMYTQSIKVRKKICIFTPNQAKLRECDKGDKPEKLVKLRRYIEDCSKNGVNPNDVCTAIISPLKLACREDEAGLLFDELLKYPFIDDIEALYKIAYTAKNHKILLKMARKNWLSLSQLLALIRMPELKKERHCLFRCIMDYLEQNGDTASHADYLKFIALACEVDQIGDDFNQLMDKKQKTLKKDFIEEIFQIACDYKNYQVTDQMEHRSLLSPSQKTYVKDLRLKDPKASCAHYSEPKI